MSKAKFGSRFNVSAAEKARRKKADRTVKNGVAAITGVTVAVTKELSKKPKSKKKAAKKSASPEYAAAVALAREEREREMMERLSPASNETAAEKIEKWPKSPGAVRGAGVAVVVAGVVGLLIPPVGAVLLAVGLYMIIRANKVYSNMKEKGGGNE